MIARQRDAKTMHESVEIFQRSAPLEAEEGAERAARQRDLERQLEYQIERQRRADCGDGCKHQ